MTRDDKIAKARELREQGMSYARIGDRLGVTRSCVTKWLNPERTKEWVRRQNARPETKTAKRTWEREHDRGQCSRCGGSMSASRKGSKVCWSCWVARGSERDDLIERMWLAGYGRGEIATALGFTPLSVSTRISVLRREGRSLPYRRTDNLSRPLWTPGQSGRVAA